MRTSANVVATALAAYDAGKSSVIDGPSNKIITFFTLLIPSTWAARLAAMLMRPRA